MSDRTLHEKLAVNLVEGYKKSMLSDEEIVQLIELGFDLLQLKTYSQAAKDNEKSYNGIKKHHPRRVEIKGIKLVIYNN